MRSRSFKVPDYPAISEIEVFIHYELSPQFKENLIGLIQEAGYRQQLPKNIKMGRIKFKNCWAMKTPRRGTKASLQSCLAATREKRIAR
jgi:hypothetical protein